AVSQLVLPYPHFTGVTSTDGSGFSWYHAFNTRAENPNSAPFLLEQEATRRGWLWKVLRQAVRAIEASRLSTQVPRSRSASPPTFPAVLSRFFRWRCFRSREATQRDNRCYQTPGQARSSV